MKKILFITGLLWAIFQFTPQITEVDTDTIPLNPKEAVVKEKNDNETMHYRIEKISKDLRNCNFLTPRRTIQPFSLASQRIVPEVVRITQYTRIKEAEHLRKVSESVSRIATINHSALLTRMGYHVYALREIII